MHLGPEAYRADRGGASETVQKAVRVGAMNAAEQGERDASAGQVERGWSGRSPRLRRG